MFLFFLIFFSSRRRHTRCALVTGVQTCALPIYYCNTASLRLDSPREARNSRNRMASMATRMNEISAAEMRAAMIDSQLRTNDVIDPAVVAAMGAEPREAHVPAALASVAYMDRAIDLGGKIGRASGRESGCTNV